MTWWRVYFPRVSTEFVGELWTVSEQAREQFGLRWVFGQDQSGLSKAPDYIHTGKNSGYQAIGLAYLFGASRIVLLGYDYTVGPRGEKHWHGDHPKGLANCAGGRMAGWVQVMKTLAADIDKTPCKVLNASRRTALKSFQRVTLETALDEI